VALRSPAVATRLRAVRDRARPSSPDLRVRPARLADVEALVRLETASFAHDRLSGRQWRRHVAGASADAWVAVRGEDVVGAALVFHRRGSDIARLYSIAVAAPARGQGIAARLLDAVERRARARGARRLRLEVRVDNAAARGLYERAGFVEFARRAAYYEDGADAIRYQKPLEP